MALFQYPLICYLRIDSQNRFGLLHVLCNSISILQYFRCITLIYKSQNSIYHNKLDLSANVMLSVSCQSNHRLFYINLCTIGLVTKALTENSHHFNDNWYGFGGGYSVVDLKHWSHEQLYNMLVDYMKKQPNNTVEHIIHLFYTQIEE